MARFKESDLPIGDFHVKDIADKFYPECVKIDTEGRKYNRAIPVIYRLIRKMKLVMEVKDGVFYNGR
jgi:hypothetical protein